jgi:hypothetical protein
MDVELSGKYYLIFLEATAAEAIVLIPLVTIL